MRLLYAKNDEENELLARNYQKFGNYHSIQGNLKKAEEFYEKASEILFNYDAVDKN